MICRSCIKSIDTDTTKVFVNIPQKEMMELGFEYSDEFFCDECGELLENNEYAFQKKNNG